MKGIAKRIAVTFLAAAMILTFLPLLGDLTGGAVGVPKAYAATDTITRVDLTISPDNLDAPIKAGDPVVQPTFTVTAVESTLGTVKPSGLTFIPDDWLGWCRSYEWEGETEWIRYADDGVQGLFFAAGESRMMVDIWANTDAVFTADTAVYLNGQRMSFYKTYDSDTDWVGYIPRSAVSVISGIDISYDLEALHFNTAYKEKAVSDLVADGGVTAAGPGYHNIDWGDALNWQEPGDGAFNWRQPENENQYLTADRDYCIFINAIQPEDGYDFPDSIKSDPDTQFLSGEIPDLTVRVNGTVRDDVELYYLDSWSTYGQVLGAYIPIGKPSTAYVEPKLTLSGSEEPMEPGHSREFSAEITGTISDRSVNWNVTGNISLNTTITDGVLKIGADETAGAVTITAVSAADGTLYQSMIIPISYDIKPVDSVEIYPQEAVAVRGGTKQFTAAVLGEQENKAVNWSVFGNNSTATAISADGLLSVAPDESAASITVTATSAADPTKSASASVEIRDIITIKEIDIGFDLDALHFNTAYKEKAVSALVADGGVTAAGPGYHNIDWGDALNWQEPGDGAFNWREPEDENQYLTADRDYCIFINAIQPEDGYDFPASVKSHPDTQFLSGEIPGLTVRVNGIVRDDVELYYLDSWSTYGQVLGAYVPIGKLDKAGVVSISAQTYTGKALTPAVTVTCDGAKLVKGTDYTAAYKNNINAGTASVTITGKGIYKGTVTKTFKINPKAVTPKVTLAKTEYTWNGKAQKPAVTVKAGSTTLTTSDYKVTYAAGRKNVGKYTVKVTLKGNYTGTKTVSFKINPKGTTLKTLTAASKAITVKWTKQATKMSAARITGYQIQIATDSKFTKNAKSYTVKGYATVSKKLTKLTGNKKYYVRIRTYTKTGGANYYSPWSKAKAVTTKK